MLTRLALKRMAGEERNLIRDGALYTSLITGAFAYANYRLYIKKDFRRSAAHYRFNDRIQNCTPWTQLYFTWWRMPEKEWIAYHMFKPYFVLGQLDMSKEILIPRKKFVNGIPQDGFDVINPLYCYEGGKMSMQAAFAQDDAIKIDRAAIIVNRGWIPAKYRDKRSRPTEVNQRKLVKITGCYMPGKNIHDYKVPNDPDANEWHNLALEDIGMYWDLPNFDEAKYYYFHAIQFKGDGTAGIDIPTPAVPDTKDDLIESWYKWRCNESTHKKVYRGFGGITAVSLAITALAAV